MIIRKLEVRDYPEVKKMLEKIGSPRYDFIINNNTYVLLDEKIIGLFTYFLYHNIPVLKHFYILKEYRSAKRARALIKKYCDVIKCKYSIISADENYLCKFIEYYFKKNSIMEDQKMKYYLVEV